jgi:hypothetical protein
MTMVRKVIERIKNYFYYMGDSIKNRYPCRIVKIKGHLTWMENTSITYQAGSKFNLRELRIDEILEDQMIVEKFHPTDCVKLGFLSASEILLKNEKTIHEIRRDYEKIARNMFKNVVNGDDRVE